MAKVGVTESSLEDIGDAIREKLGTSDTYKPRQMAAAIRSIGPGQGVSKSVDALVDAVGIIPIVDFNDSHYIQTNGSSGTLVDIDSPQSSSNFSCIVFDCSPGDKILLNGEGGNAGRLWAFLDSENFLISNSDINIRGEDLILEVPVRQAGQSPVAKCVVNMYTSSIGACYVGETVDARIAENVDSTLTIAGKAADAYEVGNMKVKLDNLVDIGLSVLGKAADAKVTGQRLDAADSNIASANSRISMINSQLSWITPFAQEIYPRARYVYPIFDTASGAMASFPDGGDGLPVKSANVSVDPVQDLHGYSKPWTGGAGKNLLPMTVDSIKADNGGASSWSGNSKTINGVTFSILTDSDDNVVGIKANGTASGSTWLVLGSINDLAAETYILNGTPPTGTSSTYYLALTDSTIGFTPEYGSGVNIVKGASDTGRIGINIRMNYNANNLVFKPMVRLASVSDATFEPYSNICPITGHTSAAITRTGKNLLPLTLDGIKAANGGASSWSENSKTINGVTFSILTDSDDNVVGIKANGTATAGTSFILNSNVNLASANYVLSSGNTNLPSGVLLAVQTSDGNKEIANAYQRDISASIIGLAWIYITSGRTVDTTIQPMIRLASDTDAAFELYQGQVYNVTFPDAAGTVYGGTLDLNAGRLVVDCVTKTFLWSEFDGNSVLGDYRRRTKTGLSPVPFGSSTKNISNVAMRLANWEDRSNHFYIDSNSKVLVMVLHKDTPESTEIQVCYELATPITYNLTAEEITTLLGINHIWADTGDVSVEYAADPKLYINKVIANALNA